MESRQVKRPFQKWTHHSQYGCSVNQLRIVNELGEVRLLERLREEVQLCGGGAAFTAGGFANSEGDVSTTRVGNMELLSRFSLGRGPECSMVWALDK